MTDDPFHPLPVDASPGQLELRLGIALAELTPTTLWLAQFALGGNLLPPEILRALAGPGVERAAEHDLLAFAINDHLVGGTTSFRVPSYDEVDHLPG